MTRITFLTKFALSFAAFLQICPAFSMEEEFSLFLKRHPNQNFYKDTFDSVNSDNYTIKNLILRGEINSDFSKKIILFKDIEQLDLRDTDISYLGNVNLLSRLKAINLSGCAIVDANLKNLPESLEFIDVSNTPVGGAFLKSIPTTSKLEYISLKSTRITNYKALAPLINLEYLKMIDLSETYVSYQQRKIVERHLKKLKTTVQIIF